MLDQLIADDLVPSNMSPESYLDVLSLQTAIFMFAVCHVVVVVMESPDIPVMLRWVWSLKEVCVIVRSWKEFICRSQFMYCTLCMYMYKLRWYCTLVVKKIL